jgi:hypothetical protein
MAIDVGDNALLSFFQPSKGAVAGRTQKAAHNMGGMVVIEASRRFGEHAVTEGAAVVLFGKQGFVGSQ